MSSEQVPAAPSGPVDYSVFPRRSSRLRATLQDGAPRAYFLNRKRREETIQRGRDEGKTTDQIQDMLDKMPVAK